MLGFLSTHSNFFHRKLNTHYTYFLILSGAVAGPLFLSFDKKVAYHKKWRFLFPAMLLPAIFYIAWDALFTHWGIWSFNEAYITGYHIGNLPVEEVLFFFVVPYCCVFIYECLLCYFPSVTKLGSGNKLMMAMAVIFLLVGILFFKQRYTAYTFILLGAAMLAYLPLKKFFDGFNFPAFLIAYGVILVPFLLVNGFLTAIPVVLYNNAENLDFRIYTIPFEDAFYGMLLIFMNIIIYEKLRNTAK